MIKKNIKNSTWYRLYTGVHRAHKTGKDVEKYLCGRVVVETENLIEVDPNLFPENKKCQICKDVEALVK